MKYIKDFKKTKEWLLIGWTLGTPEKQYMPECFKDCEFIYTKDKIKKQPCNAIYVMWKDFLPELCEDGVVLDKYSKLEIPFEMALNPMEFKKGHFNCYMYIDMDELYKRIGEV